MMRSILPDFRQVRITKKIRRHFVPPDLDRYVTCLSFYRLNYFFYLLRKTTVTSSTEQKN